MNADALSKLILAALPGVITAILASYLAARWSLRAFYSEKRWERKERAYAEIIEALYDLLQYSEIRKEDYGGGPGYAAEKMKDLEEKYRHAFWAVKKWTDVGALVMSNQALTILKELSDRPQLKWGQSAPWDIYERDYRWYRDTLQRLIDVARGELKSR